MMSDTIPFAAEGYTDLPPGTFAAIVTCLEMTARPAPRAVPERPDLSLKRLTGADLALYLRLYAEIGEDLLWFSRRRMAADGLRAILDDPAVSAHAVMAGDRPVGILELDAREGGGEVELAFFGLVPDAVGGGAGRWVMERAITLAWDRPDTRRFWVHTCNYDHPSALAFYQRSGFRPYKFAVELSRDPRLTGDLPETAAPQVPLIR